MKPKSSQLCYLKKLPAEKVFTYIYSGKEIHNDLLQTHVHYQLSANPAKMLSFAVDLELKQKQHILKLFPCLNSDTQMHKSNTLEMFAKS